MDDTGQHLAALTPTPHLPVAPAAVVLCGGTNDMFFGQTLSTFQTAYQTYISGVRTEAASAKIFCREILPNNRNGPTLTASYNAKIEAAFTAVGDGNAAYWNVDTWINADAIDLIDNSVHPSVAGEAKIGAQEITKLIAAGF